jgi:glutamine synthetase type III
MMEQILECLLAEMKAMQQKIETNHERMKAKVDAFQEKVYDGQEEVRAQVDSLTSWIEFRDASLPGYELSGELESLEMAVE